MAAYPSLIIDWPPTEGAPDFQVISTPLGMGYRQTRAATTVAPRVYSFHHRTIAQADVVTWLTFWNARKGPAESFTFTDHRTGAVVTVRFHPDRMSGHVEEIIVRKSPNAYDIGPIVLEEAF
jgi:hypothetical protein